MKYHVIMFFNISGHLSKTVILSGGRSQKYGFLVRDGDDGDDDEYQFPPSFPFFASLTNMYAANAAEGGKERFTREA